MVRPFDAAGAKSAHIASLSAYRILFYAYFIHWVKYTPMLRVGARAFAACVIVRCPNNYSGINFRTVVFIL